MLHLCHSSLLLLLCEWYLGFINESFLRSPREPMWHIDAVVTLMCCFHAAPPASVVTWGCLFVCWSFSLASMSCFQGWTWGRWEDDDDDDGGDHDDYITVCEMNYMTCVFFFSAAHNYVSILAARLCFHATKQMSESSLTYYFLNLHMKLSRIQTTQTLLKNIEKN